MPIEIRCDSCGKRYLAEDHFAGRTIRCRKCQATFAVPDASAPEPLEVADPSDPLAALAAIQTQPDFGHDSTLVGHSQIDLPAPEEDLVTTPAPRHRGRFNYPYAAVVDRWLPILLLVGGTLWVALTAFSSDDHASPGLCISRLLVLLVTYLVLIFPMGLAGVKMAARDLGFTLPRTSTSRALATFMPTFSLGAVMWMVSDGHVSGLILGLIAGFIVSAGTLWLLFHLQPSEVPAAAGYAGGMTALGVGVAAGLLFGFNMILSSAMVGLHRADSLDGSPVGAGFYWPKSVLPAVVSQPKQADKGTNSSTSLSIAPTVPAAETSANSQTDNGNVAGNSATSPPPEVEANSQGSSPSATPPSIAPPVPAPPTPGPNAPAPTSPGANSPSDSHTAIASNAGGTKPGAKPTMFDDPLMHDGLAPAPSPKPTNPLPEDFLMKTALVETVDLAPIQGPYDLLIRPATQGSWAAILRRNEDYSLLDRIWTGPGAAPADVKPWKPAGSISVTPDRKVVEKYAISPNGDLLAHVYSFPSYSVTVNSYAQNGVIQTLALTGTDTDGDADVLGFATNDRLLVHRRKDARDLIEVWDVKANTLLKSFEIPRFDTDPPPVLSPDGTTLAIAARDPKLPHDKSMTIFLYALPSGTERKLAIPNLTVSSDTLVTGLSFSADGSKIAALFEEGANGLLVSFNLTGKTQEFSKPLLPIPSRPQTPFSGSALVWIGNNALLLYGRTLLSSSTGAVFGDLGVLGVSAQAFLPPDVCHLNIQTLQGVAVVKLKMADIERLAKAK